MQYKSPAWQKQNCFNTTKYQAQVKQINNKKPVLILNLQSVVTFSNFTAYST